MLTDALKQRIQSAFSQLLKNKQLQTRPGQKRMIAEIARTLASVEHDEEGRRLSEEAGVCVVEAGTGTGKTLAYLVSALPVAQALNKKLIVSTATVALQEQVLNKDIPDLLKHSDLQFTYMLAKGRGRYLCLAKLDNALRANSSSAAMRDLFRIELQDPGELDRTLYEKMLELLAKGQWSGDRDEWKQSLEDEVWRPVAVEKGQCSGSRCSYFSNCCYFKSREGLLKADCIVANHDLVLSDLALGGGVFLPAPQDSIYVFDEAHQLPGKSLSHFSHQLRLGSTARWLEQFAGILSRMPQELPSPNRFAAMTEALARQAQEVRNSLNERYLILKEFSQQSESVSADGFSRQYVFSAGKVKLALRESIDALAAEFVEMEGVLARIVELLRNSMENEGGEIERQQAELWFPLFGSAQIRIEAAAACCRHFSRAEEQGMVPEARWLSFREFGNELEITVSASPVLAAVSLQDFLWEDCYAAVLTSATLTTLGSFDFLRKQCGLPEASNYQCIESPFSHREAAVLQIPRKGFDPANATAHTDAIVAVLPTLLQGEKGALVLFSSRRQLLDVLAALPREFVERVLAQDDYSKQELLRLHKATIDAGEESVIFGLASMAEGIDLPGEYCTHVVIAKIPFPVPNDPVDATLGDWVKQQGGNPFQEISVPEACLRLIQASGRLLRQESDTGTITVLDERLLTRGYGKAILDSLPPYQRKILLTS